MTNGLSPGTPRIALLTATSIVISNMVGTGVFTSLGFQVGPIPSGFAILLLWLIGGVCALCGALAYGELAAALPRSGGEYHFLACIFHPALGFLAGWLSATVGFAAPIALAAIAFGKYFAGVFPAASPVLLSVLVVFLVTLIHLRGLQFSARFQVASTLLKVALIVVFIVAGALAPAASPITFAPRAEDWRLVTSAPFAVSLVYVMYAYLGWNAATYIVGEVRDPGRTVPRALLLGTAAVTLLYLLINWVFLRVASLPELAGELEVGHLAATHIFGSAGGRLMAGLICLGLISSISAMTWIGPRVSMVMGEDYPLLAPLARKNPHGIPTIGLLVQLAITAALLLTATFQQVLTYVQFSLTLCSFLTVLGVLILRRTQPELPRPYRTWGYPFTPLLFLAISLWMLVQVALTNPRESFAGLGTLVLGLAIYFLSPRTRPQLVTAPSML